MFGLWISGVLKRRAGAMALAYGGVAMAVCLVGLIAAGDAPIDVELLRGRRCPP